MIYIKLLLSFLKIGLFSFGGAYGAIPLIQDVVLENNWADTEMFANLVALSEATPGPIMVNMAAYIGSQQAGLRGALLAVIGVVFPSFAIILIVTVLFLNILKKPYIQAVLKGIKPCLTGVILATGTYMATSICIEKNPFSIDFKACIIYLLLAAVIFLHRKFRGKEVSPILLIVFSAICGCLLY